MRHALLLLLCLTGCASANSNWPSLAQRPGERATAAATAPAPAPAVPAAPVPTAAPPAGPAIVAAARIAEAERDIATTETRWREQAATTRAAVAAARGTSASSDAWAKGQLELSRLEKAGAQATDLRDGLDAIAGDLATAAAHGGDVAGSLAAVGRLIDRIEKLRAEHGQAFDAAQRGLQR